MIYFWSGMRDKKPKAKAKVHSSNSRRIFLFRIVHDIFINRKTASVWLERESEKKKTLCGTHIHKQYSLQQ